MSPAPMLTAFAPTHEPNLHFINNALSSYTSFTDSHFESFRIFYYLSIFNKSLPFLYNSPYPIPFRIPICFSDREKANAINFTVTYYHKSKDNFKLI